ncbi:hypothetical protein V2J09_012501 [Rumex salicifolius]
MKQKIIIKVQIACHKCKTKALKIAAGVVSVTVQGDEALVVTGRCVDPVALTATLRKKVGVAILLSVEEIKDQATKKDVPGPANKADKEPSGGGDNKADDGKEKPAPTPLCYLYGMMPLAACQPCNYYYPPQQPQYCMYEIPPPDPNPCSIMSINIHNDKQLHITNGKNAIF